MMSLTNSRGRGIILSYANTFVNMCCGIFLSSFLLRELGDTEYGIYQTVSSFANYLVLLEFGTGTVMTRNLSICKSRNSSKEEIQKNISTIWTIAVILSVLIAGIALIFCANVKNIYAKTLSVDQISYACKMLGFITAYLIASFYIQTLNGAILACEKYTFSSTVTLVRTIIRTILLVSLILVWKYSIVIAIVDMLLSVLIACYTYLYCKRSLGLNFNVRYFDKNVFTSSVGLCVAIFLQVIINQSNNNVDKFIIGIMVNPESVAVYSVGMYIYSIFSSLTTIPISMYAPEVARNITNGLKGKALTDSLIVPSRIIVIIGGSVLFGFIAVGRQFITLLYGTEYLVAWYIALLIMVPMFINMSNGILINVLDVMNKRMSRSLILLITTVANIIMTVFFLEWFGIVGAAAATAIATLCGQIVLMNIYYSKVIGIKVVYMFREIYRGILPFQIAGALGALVVGYYLSNALLSFLIGGIVYVLVFGIGFFCFGANEAEKRRIFSIIERVKLHDKE